MYENVHRAALGLDLQPELSWMAVNTADRWIDRRQLHPQAAALRPSGLA